MSQHLLLEDLIQKALLKINGKKETDLCRFLPISEGYMHHFTFRNMVHKKSQQLFDLIQKYIIEPDKPQVVQIQSIEQPDQINRKIKQFTISEDEMEHILEITRQAQDLDFIEKLKNKQSFYLED